MYGLGREVLVRKTFAGGGFSFSGGGAGGHGVVLVGWGVVAGGIRGARLHSVRRILAGLSEGRVSPRPAGGLLGTMMFPPCSAAC